MLYESIHIENRLYTKLFVCIQIENRLYEMLLDVIQIENMFLVHCKKKNWQIVAAFLIAYKSRMDPRNMNIMRGSFSLERKNAAAKHFTSYMLEALCAKFFLSLFKTRLT